MTSEIGVVDEDMWASELLILIARSFKAEDNLINRHKYGRAVCEKDCEDASFEASVKTMSGERLWIPRPDSFFEAHTFMPKDEHSKLSRPSTSEVEDEGEQ